MSRLYKSQAVVVGDPLEIKNETEKQNSIAVSEKQVGQHNEKEDILDIKSSEIIKRAQDNAVQLIDQAKQKSLDMYAKAQEDGYNTGFEEGYTKGIEEGQIKGRQQGLDTAQEMIEEALEMRRRALETKEQIIKEAEAEIIRIVLEVSRKLIGEQMKIDREAVLWPVRKALEKCAFSSKVIMKVSSEDYDVVELSKNRLLAELEGISQLEIIADDALPLGSCLLETDAGYINSGLEVQLSRIEKSFRELLGHE